MPSSKDSLSPEMIKILKIFGIGSLLLVFLLSFFNERRANNSGEEASLMRITDADRLFFKNIRAPYYDIEGRSDAKMTIYKYGKRFESDLRPVLNLSIIINQVKDEAYIYLEFPVEESPIRILWENKENEKSGELEFHNGDKHAHLEFVEGLNPLLEENTKFQLWYNNEWVPILEEEKEREALKTPIADYFRMINYP
ncbi:hypothetical protein [Shivajiella indica]|uniref:Uncharacterized protein n=1 Tax=Shivajiella indica TaxID=872115 RepID=A0ABW5B316_9BACT